MQPVGTNSDSPGHLGQACWAPLGVTPPWWSWPDSQEGNSGECLRGCGLYGREAHCLLAPLPARARDPLGKQVALLASGPGLGWPLLPLLRSLTREHLLCAGRGPGPPTAQGLSALLWEPAGSSCMAPGPTQPPVQGPYSLLTAWAGTGALPSRPVWDKQGGSPWEPLVRLRATQSQLHLSVPVVSGETYSVGRVEKEAPPAGWDQGSTGLRASPGPAVVGMVQEGDLTSRGCGPHRRRPSGLTSSPFAHWTLQRTPPSGPKQTPLESTQLPGANVSV